MCEMLGLVDKYNFKLNVLTLLKIHALSGRSVQLIPEYIAHYQISRTHTINKWNLYLKASGAAESKSLRRPVLQKLQRKNAGQAHPEPSNAQIA